MPPILASDVAMASFSPSTVAGTAPVPSPVLSQFGRPRVTIRVTFPTTNTQYQTGGVPLSKSRLGFPVTVRGCQVVAKLAPRTAKMCPFWRWNGDGGDPRLVAYTAASDPGGALPMAELANNTVITANSQVLLLEVEGY